MDLAVSVAAIADNLCEQRHFALADQLTRSSISVPSNIAEGYGRITTRDWRRFLGHSRGSLYEVETQLEIALRTGSVGRSTYDELQHPIATISAGLSRLIDRAGRRIDVDAAITNRH